MPRKSKAVQIAEQIAAVQAGGDTLNLDAFNVVKTVPEEIRG